MNKIKEHHDLERQMGVWQIGLAEGAFSRGMGQAGVLGTECPLPSLSLCVLLFPVISPAPHLSPLCEAHVKARVSATLASFSSIQKKWVLFSRASCCSPLAACSLCLSRRCLVLGEAAPSVFQWNIWWDFSFHTIMLFNSSAIFSSLFSLRSTSKLWGVFSFC